jgi:hypothetical protein
MERFYNTGKLPYYCEWGGDRVLFQPKVGGTWAECYVRRTIPAREGRTRDVSVMALKKVSNKASVNHKDLREGWKFELEMGKHTRARSYEVLEGTAEDPTLIIQTTGHGGDVLHQSDVSQAMLTAEAEKLESLKSERQKLAAELEGLKAERAALEGRASSKK